MSFSFANAAGGKFPHSEFGYVGFDEETGENESGVQVPRVFIWDRATGKFYGELSQKYDGKPAYEVVVDQSAKFESVSAKPGEVTVIGGRRDYKNWHSWRVVVPKGQTLSAKLELRDEDGKTLRLLQEDKLGSGYNSLQLQFVDYKPKKKSKKDAAADAIPPNQKTFLKTDIIPNGGGDSAKEIKKELHRKTREFKIPHFTVDESPTLKDHTSYFAEKPPLRIIEKLSTDKKQTLVWVIE